jgi:hypothetical protein
MKEKQPKKVGRPKAILNWKKIAEYIQAGCSTVEISAKFGVDVTTLHDRCVEDNGKNYSLFSQENKSKGDVLLRKIQFDKAIKGDNTMIIWLGKNRLGQRDKPEETPDGNLPKFEINITIDKNESTDK